MAHHITGLIGREATFRALGADRIGQEPRTALTAEWAFVPLDDENLDALVEADQREVVEGFELLTPNLLDMLRAWSAAGGLAYIETDYSWGMGAQGAVVASGGQVVSGPRMGPIGTINAALAVLGIPAPTPGLDGFEALGLTRYRDNSSARQDQGS